MNTYDKDGRIALGTNFIINLDELKEFSSKNMSSLKSILSLSNINIRLPYARQATNIKRICSFIGSTNNSQFLSDETGNTRWLCFSVNDINFNYDNQRTKKKDIDIDDVYAQAYALYKKDFYCEPTQRELEDIEENNIKYKSINPDAELLSEYFEPSDQRSGEFLTSAKICDYIQNKTQLKINPIAIGRALATIGFKKTSRRSKEKGITKIGYGYWINILK